MKNFNRYFVFIAFVVSVFGVACESKTNSVQSSNGNDPIASDQGNNDEARSVENDQATSTNVQNDPSQTDLNDAGTKSDAAQVPTNQAECLAVCETSHPEGKVKADKIATCWNDKCNPSCTMMPDRGPTNVSPAVETKVCAGKGLVLQTPSPSCSQCTHDNCCTEWLECFSDLQSDCVKLNECANDCWRRFPQ